MLLKEGVTMHTNLRMKCSNCGYWNRVPVNKIFIEQPTSEPKVRVLIPYYEPFKTETCNKCKSIIAEPKEFIRLQKNGRNIGHNNTSN